MFPVEAFENTIGKFVAIAEVALVAKVLVDG